MTTQEHSEIPSLMERNQLGRTLLNAEKVLGKPETTELVLEAHCGKDIQKQIRFLKERLEDLDGPQMRRARFTLGDDYDTVYEGWTKGDTWNGWAMPLLERESVNKLMELNNGVDGATQFSWDGDDLIIKHCPGDDAIIEVPELSPADTKVWLCALGFTWEEVEVDS